MSNYGTLNIITTDIIVLEFTHLLQLYWDLWDCRDKIDGIMFSSGEEVEWWDNMIGLIQQYGKFLDGKGMQLWDELYHRRWNYLTSHSKLLTLANSVSTNNNITNNSYSNNNTIKWKKKKRNNN